MAGGMTHYTWGGISDSDSWWYSNTGPSHSWGGAHNFYLHWRDRAGVAAYVSDLGVGDVINADFAGDGHIDHTAIITLSTGSSSSNKWLSQHTTDKKEVSTVADWFSSGYTVYGYEMDKSENYPY
ncbi:putative amidase domain protein [compost metagenome]